MTDSILERKTKISFQEETFTGKALFSSCSHLKWPPCVLHCTCHCTKMFTYNYRYLHSLFLDKNVFLKN